MGNVITAIFSLMQSALNVCMSNGLLGVLIGLSVASLIFGLLLKIFSRK